MINFKTTDRAQNSFVISGFEFFQLIESLVHRNWFA